MIPARLGLEGVEGRTASPDSDEETSAVLRKAGEEGWKVLPVGAGPGPESGPGPSHAAPSDAALSDPAPPAPDLLLSTRRRRSIIEYEPGDLTLTVEAGASLEEVDREVRRKGQWLPLDPPGSTDATLGGVVASGLGGPLSFGFGRPRDQVLGLTLVDGEGRVLRLGGRVVKNVAGFDLVRLATGSRGSLGVITTVSLRLFPVPAADRTLAWEADDPASGWELGRRLSALPLPLSALELVVEPAGAGVSVTARVLGSRGSVDRMTRELEGVAGEARTRMEGEETREHFRGLAEAEARGNLTLRARALPSRGAALVEAAMGLAEEVGKGARVFHRLGTGELRMGWSGQGTETWAQSVAAFRARSEELEGSFRLLVADDSLPGTVRAATPPAPAVAALNRALRRAFDPRGILPGAWREGA